VGAIAGMNGPEREFADILLAASMSIEGHEVPAVATDPIVFPALALVWPTKSWARLAIAAAGGSTHY